MPVPGSSRPPSTFTGQGLDGTGIKQILTDSDAPKGSLYFHFPGGKEDLAVEALTIAGDTATKSLTRSLAGSDNSGDAVASFTLAFAALTASSNYELGCPLATATLEAANSSEKIRAVARSTFAK